MSTAVLTQTTSTIGVPPAERLSFWEDYNRRELVSLRCRSYAEEGLVAQQSNFAVGSLGLADISGNAHVIERTTQGSRHVPKDSIFISLLLAGEAVFMNEHGSLSATAGEIVVYDTAHPYLFGFSSAMHQHLIDVPRELFNRYAAPAPAPRSYGRASARESDLVGALRGLLAAAPANPVELTQSGVLQVLSELLGPGPGGDPYTEQRLAAQEYVARQLADPGLTPKVVAAHLGVSERHLARIFAPTALSPARYITELRLERAKLELATDTTGTIADIAYRCGFSSQAHLSRLFRARFGTTPSSARAD